MNLEPRQHYTNSEKRAFYESAAKRFKAELRLTGATAAIHIENKNDEIFWGKVLKETCPNKKFRFISASRSISGNMTAGCTQCLQYREFLDKNFWIAIDSDYRYLTEESGIDVYHYVLQTYTYSFENHFCYTKNCERTKESMLALRGEAAKNEEEENLTEEAKAKKEREEEFFNPDFSFEIFLRNYSRIVYPLLVWQLYLSEVGEDAFPKSVFHRLLTLPVGRRSLQKDGESVLMTLKDRTHKLLSHLRKEYPEADMTWYEARCNAQGVHRDNCYLFVRGHQLYDLIIEQGRKFDRKFEKELTSQLFFDDYDEIRKLKEDILYLINKK